MRRLFHPPPEFSDGLSPSAEELGESLVASPSLTKCPDPSKFKYLFPELHTDASNFLPESSDTVCWLKELGQSMCEKQGIKQMETTIPSVF